MKKLALFLSVFFTIAVAHAQPDLSKAQSFKLKNFDVQVSPDQSGAISYDALSFAVMQDKEVKAYLLNSKFSIISQQLLQVSNGSNYLLKVYDYSHNYCLLIKTNTITKKVLDIAISTIQPDPSEEEFDKAVMLALQSNPKLIEAYKQQKIQVYKPMPPLDVTQVVDGKIQRTLTVGIESNDGEIKNEIVGVNMILDQVVHYKNGAPPTSRAGSAICGIDNARQITSHRIADGSMWFSVKQGDVELWKFLVTRPAASSGKNASGVDLQNVSYLGRSVLSRAHVPVLNVKYDNNACGPYRDWMYEEGAFVAKGEKPAPGFMICDKRPISIIESGSDTGNFRGVAAFATDSDFVLTSELNAGWYRYVMEWHFYPDGTIEPKFEFSAVSNSCVCNIHHHHVYWRFDFDIDSPMLNQVAEFNTGSDWVDINTERSGIKDTALHRRWRISNTATGSAYILKPGPHDGEADPQYGIADLWVLKDNGNAEMDDGVNQSDSDTRAAMNQYVNGEDTHKKNIVVWYGAHFTHDISSTVRHEVGPKLICAFWPPVGAVESIKYAETIK